MSNQKRTKSKSIPKQTYLKIPASILQDKDLTNMTIKSIFAEIDYLDNVGDKPGCWMNNSEMAKFLGLCADTVSKDICKLEDLGKIRRIGTSNNRVLFSNLINRPKDLSGDDVNIPSNHPKDLSDSLKDLSDSPKDLSGDSSGNSLYIDNKRTEVDNRDNNFSFEHNSNDESDSNSKNSRTGKKEFKHDSFCYLASKYLLELILERWSGYDKSRLQNQNYREKKLQKWATSIDFMKRIDKRPEAEIVEVIEWAQNDKFWWKNILSTEKLRKQYDRLLIEMKKIGSNMPTGRNELIEDPNPALTQRITKSIQRRGLIKEGFTLTNKRTNQIRKITAKMIDFYKDRPCKDRGMWIEDLYDCINDNNLKGKPGGVSLGTLCSDWFWDTLMTQMLSFEKR